MKYFIFLLFSVTILAQNKPLQLVLDNITSIDSTATERIYSLEYHIENTSNKTVSFILNAEKLIPISSGSMSHNLFYKIFEVDDAVNRDDIFNDKFNPKKEFMYFDNDSISIEEILKKQHELQMQKMAEIRRKQILDNIITLQPNETKKWSTKLYWDKTRYRKKYDIEYYINEDTTYFLQLDMNLMLEEFKDRLSEEEFQNLVNNKNFIKGWYTSNKIEINFNE